MWLCNNARLMFKDFNNNTTIHTHCGPKICWKHIYKVLTNVFSIDTCTIINMCLIMMVINLVIHIVCFLFQRIVIDCWLFYYTFYCIYSLVEFYPIYVQVSYFFHFIPLLSYLTWCWQDLDLAIFLFL